MKYMHGMDFGGFGLPLWRNCVNETIGILLTICFFSLKSGDALWFSFYFCAMKLMEMKKPNFPTATPDLLERLYKKGVIWIVLAIVFFTVHSRVLYGAFLGQLPLPCGQFVVLRGVCDAAGHLY